MKPIYIVLLMALDMLALRPVLAQSSCANMIKNIGFEKRAGDIEYVTKINENTALFYAEDQYYGHELWRTDGTPQGTSLVKDIAPGTKSSRNSYPSGSSYTLATINKPVVLDGVMYFEANDGINGFEVWRSDGTNNGTFMLKDVNNDVRWQNDEQNRYFTIFNNEVYFWDDSKDWSNPEYIGPGKLFRLFKTKGTMETTILVGEFAGEAYSRPPHLVEFKGLLSCVVRTPRTILDKQRSIFYQIDKSGKISQTELHVEGTFGFGVANGQLYFSNQKGLFKSDGTVNGTELIREKGSVFTGANQDGVFWGDGKLVYFLVSSNLWRTDGTMTGTFAIRSSLTFDSFDLSKELIFIYKNELHFVDSETTANRIKGTILWKTNGTVEGTIPVVNIDPENKGYQKAIRLVTEINGYLYFYGKIDGVTSEISAKSGIYQSDGTSIGTKLLCPLGPNLTCQLINPTFQDYGFVAVNKSLLFLGANIGFDGNYGDAELHRTNLISCPSITATVTGTAAFCPGGTTTLSATAAGGTGPYIYRWQQGTTTVGTGAAALTINVAGTYTVTATDVNGCAGTAQVIVSETPGLPVSITGNPGFCAGASTALTASVSGGTAPLAFQWKQGTTNVGTNSNTYAAAAAGSYAVEVADSKGCKGTSSPLAVTQRPAPTTPTVTASVPAIVTGETATLRATVATGLTVQWMLNNAPIAGATQTTYAATQAGSYTVRATNGEGCSATSQAVTVSLITALEEPQTGTDFRVSASPNPSSGAVEVQLYSQRGKTVSVLLTIRDLMGRSLYQKQIRLNGQHTERLDLSQHPDGMYLLNATTEQQQTNLRLIRQ